MQQTSWNWNVHSLETLFTVLTVFLLGSLCSSSSLRDKKLSYSITWLLQMKVWPSQTLAIGSNPSSLAWPAKGPIPRLYLKPYFWPLAYPTVDTPDRLNYFQFPKDSMVPPFQTLYTWFAWNTLHTPHQPPQLHLFNAYSISSFSFDATSSLKPSTVLSPHLDWVPRRCSRSSLHLPWPTLLEGHKCFQFPHKVKLCEGRNGV